MGPPGDSSMGGARGPQDSEANRKNSAARPVGNTVSLRQDRYFYQLHLNRRNETGYFSCCARRGDIGNFQPVNFLLMFQRRQ